MRKVKLSVVLYRSLKSRTRRGKILQLKLGAAQLVVVHVVSRIVFGGGLQFTRGLLPVARLNVVHSQNVMADGIVGINAQRLVDVLKGGLVKLVFPARVLFALSGLEQRLRDFAVLGGGKFRLALIQRKLRDGKVKIPDRAVNVARVKVGLSGHNLLVYAIDF